MARRNEPLDVEELIDLAWDSSTDAKREKYARQALTIDPDAIDAYNLLALGNSTPAEKVALLGEAVAIGRRKWAAEIKRPAQHPFWLDIETRPFMRAVHHLALLLWQNGRRDEAVAHAELLLKLNRNDNQGIRHLAVAWHGALSNWDAVERLLRRYKDDGSAELAYPAALDAFRRGARAEEMLDQAIEANAHVPAFLLRPEPVPRSTDSAYLEWGSPEEAAAYVAAGRDAWLNVPGALDWLAKSIDGKDSLAARRQRDLALEEPGDDSDIGLSEDLVRLDALLESCDNETDAMVLPELEGYLCGILCCSRQPAQSQWLPPIWGGSAMAFGDDPARSEELVALVLARKDEIAALFRQGGLAYEPVFMEVEGSPLWHPFVHGFGRALDLDKRNINALATSRDEDLRAAVDGITRYVQMLGEQSPAIFEGQFPEPDDDPDFHVSMTAYFAETIYRRQNRLKRVVMGDSFELGDQPVRVTKIGRNDPCPCGSGKKHKKCCGAS